MPSVDELKQMPQQEWLRAAPSPLHTWLAMKMEPEAQKRLTAVGNVVIPAFARMGLGLLARMALAQK